MIRYTQKFSSSVFFPPDGPNDRFQYFHELVIRPDEKVDFATCVLCSMRVEGVVYRGATTLWGDVTVEPNGVVVGGIEVGGGSVQILPGAKVAVPPAVTVNGGTVVHGAGIDASPAFIHEFPNLFYPGQRSWSQGALLFAVVVLVTAFCGGEAMPRAFATNMTDALQRPWLAFFWGTVVLWLPGILLFLATLSLYLFAPLAVVFYAASPLLFWIGLSFGIAAISEEIGVTRFNGWRARLAGAAVLTGFMLVPVVGAFVMLASMLLGLGAAVVSCYRIWPRMKPVGSPNPERATT